MISDVVHWHWFAPRCNYNQNAIVERHRLRREEMFSADTAGRLATNRTFVMCQVNIPFSHIHTFKHAHIHSHMSSLSLLLLLSLSLSLSISFFLPSVMASISSMEKFSMGPRTDILPNSLANKHVHSLLSFIFALFQLLSFSRRANNQLHKDDDYIAVHKETSPSYLKTTFDLTSSSAQLQFSLFLSFFLSLNNYTTTLLGSFPYTQNPSLIL